jgi:hypothetical protein
MSFKEYIREALDHMRDEVDIRLVDYDDAKDVDKRFMSLGKLVIDSDMMDELVKMDPNEPILVSDVLNVSDYKNVFKRALDSVSKQEAVDFIEENVQGTYLIDLFYKDEYLGTVSKVTNTTGMSADELGYALIHTAMFKHYEAILTQSIPDILNNWKGGWNWDWKKQKREDY